MRKKVLIVLFLLLLAAMASVGCAPNEALAVPQDECIPGIMSTACGSYLPAVVTSHPAVPNVPFAYTYYHNNHTVDVVNMEGELYRYDVANEAADGWYIYVTIEDVSVTGSVLESHLDKFGELKPGQIPSKLLYPYGYVWKARYANGQGTSIWVTNFVPRVPPPPASMPDSAASLSAVQIAEAGQLVAENIFSLDGNYYRVEGEVLEAVDYIDIPFSSFDSHKIDLATGTVVNEIEGGLEDVSPDGRYVVTYKDPWPHDVDAPGFWLVDLIDGSVTDLGVSNFWRDAQFSESGNQIFFAPFFTEEDPAVIVTTNDDWQHVQKIEVPALGSYVWQGDTLLGASLDGNLYRWVGAWQSVCSSVDPNPYWGTWLWKILDANASGFVWRGVRESDKQVYLEWGEPCFTHQKYIAVNQGDFWWAYQMKLVTTGVPPWGPPIEP